MAMVMMSRRCDRPTTPQGTPRDARPPPRMSGTGVRVMTLNPRGAPRMGQETIATWLVQETISR